MMRFALPYLFLLPLLGCSSIENLSDEDLARYLEDGARIAIQKGLKLAVDKAPEFAAKIKADALIANKLIKSDILPVFSKASADVLRSALDSALVSLPAKIQNPNVQAALTLGLDVLLANVKLPENPAQKLDERTKKALVGFFTGLSAGIDRLEW